MSTETTNKKIKIDNGTTFGRTYTDKAMDELLKNVDSVFDITPYLISQTSISVEGYNALRNFVLTNKGGIIKFSMSENHYLLGPCTNIYEDSLIFSWSLLFDNGHYDADFNEYKFNNNGNITVSSLLLNQVLANPTENATEALSTVRIGNKVYSIPVGEDYSTEISALNSRVDSLANEVGQYSGAISTLESRVSSLETASTSYAQASDVSTLDSRVSDIENTIGDINSILDNINGEVI